MTSDPQDPTRSAAPSGQDGIDVDGMPDTEMQDAGDDQAGRGRIKKAPNAFRTISEVADDLHIPQHVLRFWETKFSQVKPMKRGGGRRYYRPDDIALLRRISNLLYIQGYTIKGVQRLLREGGGRLAEDIPPAPAEERAAAGAEQEDMGREQPDLLIPGLEPENDAPPAPAQTATPRTPPRKRAEIESSGRPSPNPEPAAPVGGAPGVSTPVTPDPEVERLRTLLRETLVELEALRKLLG
jgi:DNA-binding transcriptional MerR regulator